MDVLVWLVEGTWRAVVDAARGMTGPGDRITMLHVVDPGVAGSAHGAFAGLMGRGGRRADPGHLIASAEAGAESGLLAAAAERLDHHAEKLTARGRPERAVIEAAAGRDLLIVARDGDPHRPGPRSLSPATRFVVDHAPCALLLVWPRPPEHTDLPPAPPPHGGPHDGPHGGPHGAPHDGPHGGPHDGTYGGPHEGPYRKPR